MKKLTFLTTVLLGAFFMQSCLEKDEPTNLDFIQTAQDEALVESLFEDANQESDVRHAESDVQDLKSTYEAGPTVTVDTTQNSTRVITVDFGEGVVGRNGWTRKGIMQIEVFGRYKDAGSYRIVTFNNFYINNNKIEGTHTVTNNGFDSTEMCIKFTVEVENGKITTEENEVITWESTRTRKWIAGYNTVGLLGLSDDEYEITGQANGVNSDGIAYTKTITEPLFIKAGCQYIQKGKISVDLEGKKEVIIDYSYANDEAEECNEDAQMVINGNPVPFKMNRKGIL